MLSFTACSGNFAQNDLKEKINIPQSGIIEKSVFDKIKNENAIVTFAGVHNGINYEWIVFGRDINETRDINLSLVLEKTEKGIKIKFGETEDFGFSALLSVHLNEKWKENRAIGVGEKEVVYDVSITGSTTSILNISVDRIVAECEVVLDASCSGSAYENNTKQDEDDTQTDVKDIGEIGTDTIKTQEEIGEKATSNEAKEKQNAVTINPQHNVSEKETSNKKEEKSSAVTTKPQEDASEKEVNKNNGFDDKKTEKDKYETDPVPEGKPLPEESQEQEINKKKAYTCTFSIECSTILNNLVSLEPDKREIVPSNGVILASTKVTFYEEESVFDVLQRVCKENDIHLESSWTPIYNSAYIEGIHNLYEFDCGELSGWMYRVNGWYPNYGCSRYQLKDGDTVEWRYTCDLGKDVGEDRLDQ